MVSPLSLSSKILIVLIQIYQIFSKILSPCCRFRPTCSQYSIEALRRFGTIKGSWLIIQRISKCHPLHPGGDNPIPTRPSDT